MCKVCYVCASAYVVDCKTVVLFANAGDRRYPNARRSGASVKTARENGERMGVRGSRPSQARIALTALRAFRKRPKTTVLQSTYVAAVYAYANMLLAARIVSRGRPGTRVSTYWGWESVGDLQSLERLF